MTHRAIADTLGISHASTFEPLGEALDILDITPDSEHSSPGESVDEDMTDLVEDAKRES